MLLARNRTEPSLAIDPRHPRTVIVTTNTDYGAARNGIYPTAYFSSRDGGSTFSEGASPEVPPYQVGADTTVAIDAHGTVFSSYLSETASYCSTGYSAVMLAHSIDSGRSFRGPRIVDTNAADDKPNMAVESRPAASHLFLSWTRWHVSSGRSDVWLARSADGGVTFRRRSLYSTIGDNVATVPLAGPHGQIYVFWASFANVPDDRTASAQILFRLSRDDGRHFGPVRRAGPTFTHLPLEASPGGLRNLTAPAVAVSPSGTLYLAWPRVTHVYADRRVNADIVLARSTDEGLHWSSPVRLNSSRRLDRFMPALALQSDGSVAVAFYDRRNSPDSLDLYAVRAAYRSGWHVGPNVRINARRAPIGDITYIPPSDTCFIPGRFFGDYIALAAMPSGTLCIAWTDTQLGIPGETDIWLAQDRLPLPLVGRRAVVTRAAPPGQRG